MTEAEVLAAVSTALNTISPSVSYAVAPYKGTLPSAFIAYQLLPSPPQQHADDAETERAYYVQLNLWDTAGIPSSAAVDAALKLAGFVKGSTRQLPQDAQTHHYGLAIEYSYL